MEAMMAHFSGREAVLLAKLEAKYLPAEGGLSDNSSNKSCSDGPGEGHHNPFTDAMHGESDGSNSSGGKSFFQN